MRSVKPVFVNLLGLLTIILIVWGLYSFIRFAWIQLTTVQIEIAVALVAATGTVFVSVLTVVIGRYYERRQAIEAQHRERKVEIYEEFVQTWLELLQKTRDKREQGETPSALADQQELQDFLVKFTRQLILWGSSSVVSTYSSFRRLSTSGQSDPWDVLVEFEKVLYEIRKDVGNSNQRLHETDILALFINDVEQQKSRRNK